MNTQIEVLVNDDAVARGVTGTVVMFSIQYKNNSSAERRLERVRELIHHLEPEVSVLSVKRDNRKTMPTYKVVTDSTSPLFIYERVVD